MNNGPKLPTLKTQSEPTLEALDKSIQAEQLERLEQAQQQQQEVRSQSEDAIDSFGEIVRLVPSPSFVGEEAMKIGTMIPVNMADETVTSLAKLNSQFDFIDFIKDKLGYQSRLKVLDSFASEQIDALVLAITSFEKNNAFILGDQAGIGKGRVCAGVLRYAYQQGLVPIFITHKPYLFESLWRDIKNIGGFGTEATGKMIKPNPIVMHEEGGVDEEDVNMPGTKTEVFSVMKDKQLKRLVVKITDDIDKSREIKLPEPFNCVMLPYSQLSQTEGNEKQNFLEALAPKSIIVFDESHNAASSNTNAVILQRSLPLVEKAKGVLFSSATYAKSPAVFALYVVKTALKTAVSSLDSITQALKIGGENVSEYIATGLVKEGQMIRRDRSFGNCKKITEIVGKKRLENVDEDVVQYVQLENDDQAVIYNKAIGYFKELRDFARSAGSKRAISRAVARKMQELGLELANMDEYDVLRKLNTTIGRTNSTAATINIQRQNEWLEQNRNKWIVKFNNDNITQYKSTFRENLFLAIKAKFAADKIIDTLTQEVTYKNEDGTVHRAPEKPVIALKSTAEAIFEDMGLQYGQELKNDFSEYLTLIYYKLFSGSFKLTKVSSSLFLTPKERKRLNVKLTTRVEDYAVLMSDYEDNSLRAGNMASAVEVMNDRVKLERLQADLKNYVSGIPFSIIDYLKFRIESTRRPDFYFKSQNRTDAKYGTLSSEFFTLVEGTGRQNMLQKKRNADGSFDQNAPYVFLRNDRPERVNDVYKAFNNGNTDVMLINVVASTGGSAQSSPEEGVDTRPRNMFIIQFELDVNTEIQKRGRINRTGQLNSPTYTYIISQIPVELRTYLMFRKKLRKLDANTSADQQASVEKSEINDSKGRPIEDIFNQYGFDVFTENFINLPDYVDPATGQEMKYSEYRDIYNSISMRYAKQGTEEAEQIEYNLYHFEAFIRELELYPVDFQIKFFDEMNTKYLEYVENLKDLNEYQLELTAKDYKAAIRESVLIQESSGDSIFALPLFLTDFYTINDKKVWTKDKVEQKVNELGSQTINGIKYDTPSKFHKALIMDFEAERDKENQEALEIWKQTNEPKREQFTDENDFETASIRYQGDLAMTRNNQNSSDIQMMRFLTYFRPNTPVYFRGNYGKFVGYNIKRKGVSKYQAANIEFVFCFLSDIPKAVLHNNARQRDTLQEIIDSTTNYNQYIIRTQQISQQGYSNVTAADSNTLMKPLSEVVNEWKPDLTKRVIREFYTGNILSGIVEANKEKKENGTGWVLSRFINIDGSFTTAIELKLKWNVNDTHRLKNQRLSLSISAGSVNFIRYIQEMPVSEELNTPRTKPIWNIRNNRVMTSTSDSDRSVAMVKREVVIGNVTYPIIDFVVCQPYSINKDNNTIVYASPNSAKWNRIYNDDVLADNYKDYFSQLGQQTLVYAVKQKKRSESGYGFTSEYWNLTFEEIMARVVRDERYGLSSSTSEEDDDEVGSNVTGRTKMNYKVFVKQYSFNLLSEKDLNDLQSFVTVLSDKYDLSFNFRSEAGEAFSITGPEGKPLVDPYDPTKIYTKEKSFEEGDYTYQFISKPTDILVDQIPKLKERIFEGGMYGGVITSLPLTPIQCKQFELIPTSIPNEVLVKMSIYVLNDINKGNFVKDLEAKSQTEGDYEIGIFVSSFLNKNSGLSKQYFFGNMTAEEYGSIFKEYGLNKDIKNFLPNKKQIIKKKEEYKDVVTFEDAERFLRILM